MQSKLLWAGAITGAAIAALCASTAANAGNAADCPNNGIVRFGVEPYDTSARLVPLYEHIGKLIETKLGCQVKIFVATNYNAEIEAMRNGKLEIGEFGPLGYVLAHEVAKADAVAAFGANDGKPATYWASLVTYPASNIKTAQDIRGHSFAFSDPASTSGHLVPCVRTAQSRYRPGQGHQGDICGQPHFVFRSALQSQSRRRRTEQRTTQIGHSTRAL